MARKPQKKPVEKAKAPEEGKAGLPAPTQALQPLWDLRSEIDRVFDQALTNWPGFGRLSDWHPLKEMEAMFAGRRMGRFPPTDIQEGDKAFTVSMELPGLTPEDIEISLAENMMTVTGEKKTESDETGEGFHLMERTYGSFERSFRLPEGVDATRIDAAFDNGILVVTLPKKPEAQKKARKVAVKAKGAGTRKPAAKASATKASATKASATKTSAPGAKRPTAKQPTAKRPAAKRPTTRARRAKTG